MAYFEGFVAGRAGSWEAWPRPAARGQPQYHQRHPVAAAYRRAVARCAGEVRQLELDLSALPAMERRGVWESVAIALAETMAESGHYNIDSTTVRAHVSAAGGKGGFINELLAARGAGSPVKFIVSAMPEAGPSLSISRRAKRPTARLTTR